MRTLPRETEIIIQAATCSQEICTRHF